MNSSVELMNLFWTTAGKYPLADGISRFDFRDRVEAAARAGFVGIGIWRNDLEHILRARTARDMKAILDDNGIKYVELEFLTDWFVDGDKRAEADKRKNMLLEASAALHAKHIKVGDFSRTQCPMPLIVEAFAGLCREAEDYGATIGFEFMASAMIDNLKDSLAMVEAAGAQNGGLILDMAHVARLGIAYEDIGRIPLQYLVNVELNDGTLPGSPRHDPSRARRFCGEGEFDIKGFIACVRGMGYMGPWAVEVFSQELAGLSLEELNTRAFQTTMAQFEDMATAKAAGYGLRSSA
jgi:sugar phosphate isomerase/epimerase